jgi:BirA family transcriptional regulator, biotin operon repressor / biotin---[acetyl-CoA-carboxylase] ligase
LPSLNLIGTPFIELLSVESTNNYAMGLVRAGLAHHGTAVFAHNQTKGKGQRNRQWDSEGSKNIAISIIIEPHFMNGKPMFLLSMMVAMGVLNFFNRFVADDVRIKWPNDIYWRDRKAAGILIENQWQSNEWKFAVVGIGINVNQTGFGELGTKAVSLKQITGKEFEPVEMARQLCRELQHALEKFQSDSSTIQQTYTSQLYKNGEVVRLKKDNRIFDATVKEVSREGQLVVQTSVEERFDVGEVEWMIL